MPMRPKGMGIRAPLSRSCVYRDGYPLAKASHWETEKAGYPAQGQDGPIGTSQNTSKTVKCVFQARDLAGWIQFDHGAVAVLPLCPFLHPGESAHGYMTRAFAGCINFL